jgi:hypothetical protein
MEMFKAWNSFISFANTTRHKERYFYNKDIQEFFREVLATAQERIESIPKGQQYWRAQLGCNDDPCYDDNGNILAYNAVPYPTERMTPSADKACENRANPKGIPFLYLSTDETTAISEVRPWVGSYVTVAQFETLKNLRLLDCSYGEINPMNCTVSDLDKLWKLTPQEPEEATKVVWRWIDLSFSKPVDHDDKIADYVPTQIIAELFRTNGFDGIKYKSLFNSGSNVALYDINSAKQINDGKVIQVTTVNVAFKQQWPILFTRSKT